MKVRVLICAMVVTASGCAGAATPCPCRATAGASSNALPVARDSLPSSYASLFDALARDVERSHVFAEGRAEFWRAHKEELRREMAAATTREQALTALRHVQLALGDRHCMLQPPTDLRPARLSLGIEVHAARVDGRPVVRVASVKDPALADTIKVGDSILAIDGVPTDKWLDGHPFETNALNPVAHLQETAESATSVTAPWTTLKENDVRTLRFRRAETSFDKPLVFRQSFRFANDESKVEIDSGPDMAKIGCTQEAPLPYAGYALDVVGANLCVYRVKDARAKKPPIVRFLSFMYAIGQGDEDGPLRAIRVDHDLLARALAKDDAVILDIHENHGGMNPFIFVSWFASKPWGHETVHVRVGEFAADDVRDFLWNDDDLVARYTAARAKGEIEMTYPFLCKKEPCDRVGPRRSELVTTKPVAVITGPECTSSCDAISAMWASFRIGPIVGKQRCTASPRSVIRSPSRPPIIATWDGSRSRCPGRASPDSHRSRDARYRSTGKLRRPSRRVRPGSMTPSARRRSGWARARGRSLVPGRADRRSGRRLRCVS